jgi:hypothetical protein
MLLQMRSSNGHPDVDAAWVAALRRPGFPGSASKPRRWNPSPHVASSSISSSAPSASLPQSGSRRGMHDLLFNACEHALGARAWVELLHRHGFDWVCMDSPAAVLEAAANSSASDMRSWSAAKREAFEEAHPFAFGGMYEFWFVAR